VEPPQEIIHRAAVLLPGSELDALPNHDAAVDASSGLLPFHASECGAWFDVGQSAEKGDTIVLDDDAELKQSARL
jgi:hypothetical protein